MKASLPFKYITAVKGGKHYVVFDYKDNEGKRKRKWVGTDLPENCKKKELSAKVDEIVTDFYKEYYNNSIIGMKQTMYIRTDICIIVNDKDGRFGRIIISFSFLFLSYLSII